MRSSNRSESFRGIDDVGLDGGEEAIRLIGLTRKGIEVAALSARAPNSHRYFKEGEHMRKVVASLFISIDGVVEAPDQWHFPYFNDEMGAAVDAALVTDTMLFGRKTYDSFAEAWPAREAAGGEDAHFAKVLGDARKLVVSNRQLTFTWRNSEQLDGDLVEAVAALKAEPGEATIALSGSISIVRQLLAAGLLDELHLLMHPIAVRRGLRLFDEGDAPIPLRLIKSETFQTGVLNLVYEPAEPTGDATYEDAKAHLSQPKQ